MAGDLQIEQRGGMVGVAKDVGRRLVDRRRARAGDGVGMLPGMQAQGLEGGRLWRGHSVLVLRLASGMLALNSGGCQSIPAGKGAGNSDAQAISS